MIISVNSLMFMNAEFENKSDELFYSTKSTDYNNYYVEKRLCYEYLDPKENRNPTV